MRCDDAREYIMALYDGEPVPPEATQHLARCANCQELVNGFAEMGAALRGYGSLLRADPVPQRTWPTPQRNPTPWWHQGLQMMRIPRIAFACLILALVLLGSRLALVEVRAHDDGSVLMLKLTPAQGEPVQCNVSLAEAERDHCGGLAQIDKSNLFYAVKALKKDGNRVLLSIRAKVTPIGPAGFGPDTASTLPETQSWFTPGQTLAVPATGELNLALTGDWADHIPVTLAGRELLDPGPDEIRLTSPLLLKNNMVVGDMGKMIADTDTAGEGVWFYVPGEGRFTLAPMPLAGAVPATVQLNRVSFEIEGQIYVVVTGMPVTRAKKLWVLHDAAYKPSAEAEQGPEIGAGPITQPH